MAHHQTRPPVRPGSGLLIEVVRCIQSPPICGSLRCLRCCIGPIFKHLHCFWGNSRLRLGHCLRFASARSEFEFVLRNHLGHSDRRRDLQLHPAGAGQSRGDNRNLPACLHSRKPRRVASIRRRGTVDAVVVLSHFGAWSPSSGHFPVGALNAG